MDLIYTKYNIFYILVNLVGILSISPGLDLRLKENVREGLPEWQVASEFTVHRTAGVRIWEFHTHNSSPLLSGLCSSS